MTLAIWRDGVCSESSLEEGVFNHTHIFDLLCILRSLLENLRHH